MLEPASAGPGEQLSGRVEQTLCQESLAGCSWSKLFFFHIIVKSFTNFTEFVNNYMLNDLKCWKSIIIGSELV